MALLPSKDSMSQAPFTEIVAKMERSWRGHRPGIGCGRNSGLKSYMTAALGACQIQVLAHLTQSTIKLMTNEHDILAGNRSEGDFNDEAALDLPTKDGFDLAIFPPNTSSSEKLAAQNFVVLLRTRWKYTILLLMMITPWVSSCWDIDVDLAQF